jgi:hypothetical protein
MMENIARLREQIKGKQSEMAEQVVHMQAKISDQEYKIGSLSKQFELWQNMVPNMAGSDSGKALTGDAGATSSPSVPHSY